MRVGGVLQARRDTSGPGFKAPLCLVRAQSQGHANIAEACSFERDKVMARTAAIQDAEHGAVAQVRDTRCLDLTADVCPDARCSLNRDRRPLFSDGDHIAAGWATRESPRFEQAVARWPLGAASAAQPVR